MIEKHCSLLPGIDAWFLDSRNFGAFDSQNAESHDVQKFTPVPGKTRKVPFFKATVAGFRGKVDGN